MSVGMWFNPKTHCCDSDLGVIEVSRPRPDLGEVGRLCLVNKDWVDNGCGENTEPFPSWLTTEGDRKFFNIQHGNWSWKWELFDAHWTDAAGPCPCYIGQLVGQLAVTIEESVGTLES